MSKSIIDPYIGIEFEFNKLMSYQGLIDSLNNNESFLELEIGDPTTLKWDYDFLMTVMQLIANKIFSCFIYSIGVLFYVKNQI